MTNNLFVIDDDLELTNLLDEFLSSHNYHVSIFNNPLQAIDALLKNGTPSKLYIVALLASKDGLQYVQDNLAMPASIWVGDVDEELKQKVNQDFDIYSFKKIDLFNDFEYLMSILKNLDVFITVSKNK